MSFKGWTLSDIDRLQGKPKPIKKTDHRERAIAAILKENNIPFEEQYKFHPTRKFRFDFAFPQHKIAIEYEGGIWQKSRHTTGPGYARDVVKYREAVLLGWRVLRYTQVDIDKGEGYYQIINDLKKLI